MFIITHSSGVHNFAVGRSNSKCFTSNLALQRSLSVWYIQALDGWSRVRRWGQQGRQGVSHLPALFPVSGLLGFVRFDAADVVWSTFHQCAHQIVGLFLKGGVRAKTEKGEKDNDETDDHNEKLMKTQNAVNELLALKDAPLNSKHTHCSHSDPD